MAPGAGREQLADRLDAKDQVAARGRLERPRAATFLPRRRLRRRRPMPRTFLHRPQSYPESPPRFIRPPRHLK